MEAALLAALSAALDHRADARTEAEAHLRHLSCHPGFASCLVRLALDEVTNHLELRLLALLVLKQHIKAHWTSDAEAYTEPEMRPDEKGKIRADLPRGLRDSVPRIRTAVSAAIACIAQWDWPEEWPSLMGELTAPLQSSADPTRSDADALSGSLRCLELCVRELAEEHLAESVQQLLPLLLRLFLSALPTAAVQARSERLCVLTVKVSRRLLERFTMLCTDFGVNEALVRGANSPVGQWGHALLSALASKLTTGPTATAGADVDSPRSLVACELRQCVLRLLRLLLECFRGAISPHTALLLPALGAQFSSVYLAHAATLDFADEPAAYNNGACDSDDGSASLDALAAQLFDVVSAVASSSKFYTLLRPALPDIMYAAVGFARVPAASAAAWAADAEAYLHDEDDDSFAVSSRVAAQQLMVELAETLGRRAVTQLVTAAQRHAAEASAMQARGDPNWWRGREAALLALSLGAEPLCKWAASKSASSAPPLQPALLYTQPTLLPADMSASTPPLLRGRALCTASRFCACAPPEALPAFLAAASAALQPSEPLLLRLCSARALCAFARNAPQEALSPSLPTLLSCTSELLWQESEDAVAVSLETVCALLYRCDDAIAATVHMQLAPQLLAVWNAHWRETLVANMVVDCFKAMARCATVLPALVGELLPALVHVLSAECAAAESPPAGVPPAGCSEGMLPCLELLDGVVLRRWPHEAPLPQQAQAEVLPLLLRAVCGLSENSDEAETLVACACLRRFVLRGALAVDGARELWGAALRRLLSNNWNESAASAVPPLLRAVLKFAPELIAGANELRLLLCCLLAWLTRSDARLGIQTAVVHLLAEFALSEAVGAAPLVETLYTLPHQKPSTDGDDNNTSRSPATSPLSLVMELWLQILPDILEPTVHSTLFLGLLAVAQSGHQAIAVLCVPAAATITVVKSGAGRNTRARSRRRQTELGSNKNGGASQTVPLLVRVFETAASCLSQAKRVLESADGRAEPAGEDKDDFRHVFGTEGDSEADGDEIDEEGGSEDSSEDSDDGLEGGGGDAEGGRARFVDASDLSIVDLSLSNMLYGGNDSDSDAEDEEGESDDGGLTAQRPTVVDLARASAVGAGAFLAACRQQLGDADFRNLSSRLPPQLQDTVQACIFPDP